MDKDIFLKELIEFIATSASDLHPTIFKKKIRFGKGKNMYSEIVFEYIQSEKGYSLHLSSYNKEIGNFFESELGNGFLRIIENAPKDYRNIVFSQNSCATSHYYKSFPVIAQSDSYGIIFPADGNAVFDDVLAHLEAHHFKFIKTMEVMSPAILDYIRKFPSAFGVKQRALTALFVIEKNNLSIQDEKVQALFEYDEMVLKNESKLFSPFDLIFGKNGFEQAIKERILSRHRV